MTARALALFALLIGFPASAAIYIGDVDGREVHLRIDDTETNPLTGVSLRPSIERSVFPRALDVRLLTGTRDGNRVVLEEWDGTDHRSATFTGRFVRRRYEKGLYDAIVRGAWNDERVEFVYAWDIDSILGHSGEEAMAMLFERLHCHLKSAAWSDATFDARLLCAINANECAWLQAIPILARGGTPPAQTDEPWKPFVLARDGDYRGAIDAARESCERYSWIGCRFYADLATRPKVESRAVYRATCKERMVACEKYWGPDAIALIEAAYDADEKEVDRLLQTGVAVNVGGEGRLPTPVLAAVFGKSLPIVKKLVARGASVNVDPDATWLSPLFYAIYDRDEDLALFLLAHGAAIHQPNQNGRDDELLWRAAHHRCRRVVRALLAAGEKPDEWSVPAGSPLMAAVRNRDLVMAKDLLAHGADPDYSNRYSNGSPIDEARRTGQKAMLRMLLAARKQKE